ncbi:MAG: hypothetical protein JOZ69_00440, partial [Myxococcales bacterium]|nr:hypothetical protein [Myxococcales bacterium]
MSAFLSYLASGVAVGCVFALLASGLVIVQRVTRVVNLAQGMYSVLAALLAASLLDRGVPHPLAEALAVLTAAAAGWATGVVATGRPGTPPVSALILTFAVGILAHAVEVLAWGDQPRSFAGLAGAIDIAGVRIQRQYVVVVVVTGLVFVALDMFFERTYLGAALSACASNPYAARLVGIDVNR